MIGADVALDQPVGDPLRFRLEALVVVADGCLWHSDIDPLRMCPFLRVKRTSLIRAPMSATDPKRTLEHRGAVLRQPIPLSYSEFPHKRSRPAPAGAFFLLAN